MPYGPAAAGQPVFLHMPGAQECTGEFTGCKLVNAFAHARTGGILRRRYVAVVSAIMIDGEVAIRRDRQHDFRQQFLELRVLVAQLVSGIDREAGSQARDDGEREKRPGAEFLHCRVPGSADQRQEMQRHDDIGEAPVIGIALQLHHDFFRRVIRILAEDHVEDRRNAIVQEKRQQ